MNEKMDADCSPHPSAKSNLATDVSLDANVSSSENGEHASLTSPTLYPQISNFSQK